MMSQQQQPMMSQSGGNPANPAMMGGLTSQPSSQAGAVGGPVGGPGPMMAQRQMPPPSHPSGQFRRSPNTG